MANYDDSAVRAKMNAHDSPLTMEIVTDPVELARMRPQWERFDRNWYWFKEHAAEVYEAHRGKCICISGAQVFAADTSEEATALAERSHPDDDGRFTLYIPREKARVCLAHLPHYCTMGTA